jgi:hypothetical protein
MASLNLNLRGMLIEPKHKEFIHYYFMVIDIPGDGSSFDPSLLSAGTQNGDALSYTYNGTLPADNGGSFTTVIFSVFTVQTGNSTELTTVTVTDSNNNTATGDPNKKRPPIVESVNRDGQMITANKVFLSESNTSATNYFIAVMVNTLPDGGYSNTFTSINPSGVNLMCTLTPLTGKSPVCVIGVAPSSYSGQYQWAYIQTTGTTGSASIDYSKVTKI